jgi:hypothetical protein
LESRTSWIVDFLILAVLGALLIWPMFRTKHYVNWPTIHSTFIADARCLLEDWPRPGWEHLWYGGTR